jgi:hypothetical protein
MTSGVCGPLDFLDIFAKKDEIHISSFFVRFRVGNVSGECTHGPFGDGARR